MSQVQLYDIQQNQTLVKPVGEVLSHLQAARHRMAQYTVAELVDFLDAFSARLLTDPRCRAIEGIAFLSAWMRRKNVEHVLHINLNGCPELLDGFVEQANGSFMHATGRGVVGMWMAGNVPTLSIFSLIGAILSKNASLTRLATRTNEQSLALIHVLCDTHTDRVEGHELIRAHPMIWFDRSDVQTQREMSNAVDARVFWGGEKAIAELSALPHQPHCHDVVFGPKYSIAYIDHTTASDEVLRKKALTALARDIATFDQRACSAPQTLFIHTEDEQIINTCVSTLAEALSALPEKVDQDTYTSTQILNARARYALAADLDCRYSYPEVNWTLLLENKPCLNEAIQSRTLFICPLSDMDDLYALLSPKIQTVGLAMADADKARQVAIKLTQHGVARCVRPGLMNAYESPWDGTLLISELVRWVTLKP